MDNPSLTQQTFPLKQLGLNNKNNSSISQIRNTVLWNSFKQNLEHGIYISLSECSLKSEYHLLITCHCFFHAAELLVTY